MKKSNIYTQLESEFSQQVYRIGNLSNIIITDNTGQTQLDLGYETYSSNSIQDILKHTDVSSGNAYWTYLRSKRGTNTISLSRRIYSEMI